MSAADWTRAFAALPAERLVVGLMSGTSADGVDAALARISGSGRGMHVDLLGAAYLSYDDAFREALLVQAEPDTARLDVLTRLDALLAERFAEAVEAACAEAGVALADVDVIGSHGHTVQHLPEPEAVAGRPVAATLQLGNPAVLAALTGIPTVGQFRAADVALGGQGAPLVPYYDYVTFADAHETRGLLNLGGIANLTILPAGGGPEAVRAFDVGPANMVLDALARRLLGLPYDADGASAARGTPLDGLLRTLLAEPFFAQAPPKSTGRERFGSAFVELMTQTDAPADDLLATATHLTTSVVADALCRFVSPALDVLIVSGGGTRNPTLLAALAEAVAPLPVRTTTEYGVDADAKEALCFAVLAHEWLNGVPTNLPSVTGARRAARLGTLALP